MSEKANGARGASARTRRRKVFWDYYLPWILGIALAGGVLLWLLIDAYGSPKPDYRIGYAGAQSLSDEAVAALEAAAERQGEDLNGDGRVLVELDQYLLSYTGDYDSVYTQMAGISALSSDLKDVDFVCFILEDADSFASSSHAMLAPDGSEPAAADTGSALSVDFASVSALAQADLPAADAAVLADCRVGLVRNPSAKTGRTEADDALWQSLL